MAYHEPFLLGPLGVMDALPGIPAGDGADANYLRIAAEQTSLRGTTTVDVFGVRREWMFTWPLVTEAAMPVIARLAARWGGSHSGPLRLLDPNEPNMLGMDAAAGGGVTRTNDAAAATAGTVSVVTATPEPIPGLLDSAYALAAPAGAAQLWLDDTTDRRSPTRDGSISARVLVRVHTGAATARVLLAEYNAAGTLLSVSSPAGFTTLTGAWQALTHTRAPVAGAVSVAVGVDVPAGAAVRTVHCSAAQIARGATLGDWTPGGGCPPVVITTFEHAHRRLGRPEVALTVREV